VCVYVDQPRHDGINDERFTDRKQQLRSASATQLTSLFVGDTASFPPIEQPPTAEVAVGAATKRSDKKKDANSRLISNESSCLVEPTSNCDATRLGGPLTSPTSADRKGTDLSKRTNEKRSAHLSLATTRRTPAATKEPASIAEHQDVSGKKVQVEGGAKQPDTLKSKAVIHSTDRSPMSATIWRDAKVRRASMQLSLSDDPEMRLRKELRLLEKQRRVNEEQTAARRVDRARAIASERSKYGSGLAPRLEQFFSRILRTQQTPELQDRKKTEKQDDDDDDNDGNDNDDEMEECVAGTGSCAPAGKGARPSPVSSVDADEYLRSGWIDGQLDTSTGFGVHGQNTTDRLRKLDGNNNRRICSEVAL